MIRPLLLALLIQTTHTCLEQNGKVTCGTTYVPTGGQPGSAQDEPAKATVLRHHPKAKRQARRSPPPELGVYGGPKP